MHVGGGSVLEGVLELEAALDVAAKGGDGLGAELGLDVLLLRGGGDDVVEADARLVVHEAPEEAGQVEEQGLDEEEKRHLPLIALTFLQCLFWSIFFELRRLESLPIGSRISCKAAS